MRISDWSSDVCSSDLRSERDQEQAGEETGTVAFEQRKAGVAGDVHQRQPDHGVVLAEEAVGDPADQQREEVHPDEETRSEERRVGKEWVRTCRAGWSASHKNKKIYKKTEVHKKK